MILTEDLFVLRHVLSIELTYLESCFKILVFSNCSTEFVPALQELDDAMSEIKKRANHVRTNLKTMELAIEEQEKVDKTRYEQLPS